MRLRLLCACVALGSSLPSSTMAQVTVDQKCREVVYPVRSKVTASADIYRAPDVRAGIVSNVTFTDGNNPSTRRKIVDVDPLTASALFNDGSVIAFVRNVDGDGAVVGVQGVSPASCWDKVVFGKPYRRAGSNEIILSEWENLPTEIIRSENRGGYGRISRVLRFGNRPSAATEVAVPLIVSERPIHAFGVSVPSIEGGRRTLMAVTQERDGSLTVAHYAYSVRN